METEDPLAESVFARLDGRDDDLETAFRSAIAAKRDTLKTPYRQRRSNPSIPKTRHLLAAAVVLENHSAYREVKDIVMQEESDAYNFQRQDPMMSEDCGPCVPTERIVGAMLDDLVSGAAERGREAEFVACVARTLSPAEIHAVREALHWLGRRPAWLDGLEAAHGGTKPTA